MKDRFLQSKSQNYKKSEKAEAYVVSHAGSTKSPLPQIDPEVIEMMEDNMSEMDIDDDDYDQEEDETERDKKID